MSEDKAVDNFFSMVLRANIPDHVNVFKCIKARKIELLDTPEFSAYFAVTTRREDSWNALFIIRLHKSGSMALHRVEYLGIAPNVGLVPLGE